MLGSYSAGEGAGALGAGSHVVQMHGVMLLLPMSGAAGCSATTDSQSLCSTCWEDEPSAPARGALPTKQPVLQPTPCAILPCAHRHLHFCLGEVPDQQDHGWRLLLHGLQSSLCSGFVVKLQLDFMCQFCVFGSKSYHELSAGIARR